MGLGKKAYRRGEAGNLLPRVLGLRVGARVLGIFLGVSLIRCKQGCLKLSQKLELGRAGISLQTSRSTVGLLTVEQVSCFC